MKALIKKLVAWLERLAEEGVQDMSGISGEIVTGVEDVARAAGIAVHDAVAGAEAYLGAGEVLQVQVSQVAVAAAAPQTVAPIDQVLGKIKDLIDGSQQSVTVWSEVTTVAKALHTDTTSVIAKVKQLLEYVGQPVKAFDEIATLAVKLVPG